MAAVASQPPKRRGHGETSRSRSPKKRKGEVDPVAECALDVERAEDVKVREIGPGVSFDAMEWMRGMFRLTWCGRMFCDERTAYPTFHLTDEQRARSVVDADNAAAFLCAGQPCERKPRLFGGVPNVASVALRRLIDMSKVSDRGAGLEVTREIIHLLVPFGLRDAVCDPAIVWSDNFPGDAPKPGDQMTILTYAEAFCGNTTYALLLEPAVTDLIDVNTHCRGNSWLTRSVMFSHESDELRLLASRSNHETLNDPNSHPLWKVIDVDSPWRGNSGVVDALLDFCHHDGTGMRLFDATSEREYAKTSEILSGQPLPVDDVHLMTNLKAKLQKVHAKREETRMWCTRAGPLFCQHVTEALGGIDALWGIVKLYSFDPSVFHLLGL